MSYIYNMPVSATVKNAITGNNERKPVGNVEVTLFSLADMGIAGECLKSVDNATNEGEEAGEDVGAFQLVYTDKALNHVFKALVASTLATARNKLQKGSVEVKAGMKIATSLDELLAPPAARSNTYMAVAKAFVSSFTSFLASTALKAGVQATLAAYAGVQGRSSLKLAPPHHKTAMLKYLPLFVETLTAEAVAEFEAHIIAVNDAAQASEEISADDFA